MENVGTLFGISSTAKIDFLSNTSQVYKDAM